MNVLLSSCVHWWNAEAGYAAVLGEELLAAGHRVWVMTQPGTRNEFELRKRGLPLITHIPAASGNPLKWKATLAGLAELHDKERIDIVNVFRSAEHPLHLLAARGRGGPRTIRTRGSARPMRPGLLSRRIHNRWSAALIASSVAVRRDMCQKLRLPPESIPVIYYPIDLPPPPSRAERLEGRRKLLAELGLGEERLLLGVVGRLYPEKGHALLLEALERLVRHRPELYLIILAKHAHADDPERPGLEARIARAGLGEHVGFMGFREEVRELMGRLDIGVIPSISSEVNCRVAVEFMSVATPLVILPTGALPEVVEHETSGLVTNNLDPAELAAALERLAADPALRARLGAGGRQRAEERFSKARFLTETLAVFNQALAKGGE